TAVTLAMLGFGVWSIVFGDLVGKAVATIVLWIGYPGRPRLRFSRTHLFDLLRFGSSTSFEWFLWAFARRTFIAVIGYFHGPTALGYLHLATRLTDTIVQFLGGVSNRFYLPVFSALQADERRLRLVVVQASRMHVAVSVPAFLGLAAIAPMAVEVVLGARWLPAVPLIQILCLFWALSATVSAVGPYLKAIGRPSTLIFPALASTIVSLVVALAAVDLSLEEAQAGFGLRVLVITPLLLYFARTLGGLSVRRFLSSISVPCVSAVLMALAVWALEAALPTSHSWRQLIACVVAGILIYATTLYALDKQTSYLFQRVARRALGWRT
ncbi:MAG: oligosaccharide flippase family protein, partial [Burkholderiales bacterium]